MNVYLSCVRQKRCFPCSQYYRKEQCKKDCVQDNSYVYIHRANITINKRLDYSAAI